MSTVTVMRPRNGRITGEEPLEVNTTEAHVRAAHEYYSRTVPDLCGPLKDSGTEVSFLLFIPVLGQVLTHRAVVLGGAA